ncbi:MAG TPA: hypothetical protein VFE72_11185 [Lysobacter sp.]|nr:hypothetical protein [Lysobacter sp.]
MRWIWLGALMMALGGVFAAFDRRFRAKRTAAAAAPATSPATAAGAST